MAKRLTSTLLAVICLSAVLRGKEKKQKIDWKQGEVCSKNGLCVHELNFDATTPAQFNLVLVNRTKIVLHDCMVSIPLLNRDTIVSTASAFSFIGIAPGEQFWFKAPKDPGGWTMAKRAEFSCTEGKETVLFRYPVFSFWRDAHVWHKQHENDSDHGRDPNQ